MLVSSLLSSLLSFFALLSLLPTTNEDDDDDDDGRFVCRVCFVWSFVVVEHFFSTPGQYR